MSKEREYERLTTESYFKSQTQHRILESAITISLLNTPSFEKHFRDILMGKYFLHNE